QAKRLPPAVHRLPAVATVPLAYPLASDPPGFEARQAVVFVGGFQHQPNVDAVLFFARSVWPEVVRHLPEARFRIVGPDAPAAVQALASRTIEVVGHVADLTPVLNAARLAVAPLRYGAGMKGKVVQALAAGLPVVTTPIGAEGLPVVPGRHALVAETPADLAQAVIRAYTDAALWQQLAQAGQALIAAHYSEVVVALRLYQAAFGPLPSAPGRAGERDGAAAPPALPAGIQALHALLDGLEWHHLWHSPEQARVAFQTAAGLDPTLHAAPLAEAELYLDLDEIESAQRAWEQANEQAPRAPGVQLLHAELLTRRGQYGPASQRVDAVFDIDPKHPAAMRLKIELAYQAGALPQMWEMLRSAVKLHPTDYRLFRLLCEMTVRAGETDEALRLLPQAMARASALGFNADERRYQAYLEQIVSQLAEPLPAAQVGPRPAPPAPRETAPPPEVAVVVPIYGNAPLVRRCVESVLRTAPEVQLILVDDASPGSQIRKLLAEFRRRPNVSVVRLAENQGFIGACHAGADRASAPFILFLNSDVEAVEPGWLNALLPQDSQTAIVGARLLFPPDARHPAGRIQHAGVARNAQGQPYHPFYGLPADHPLAARAHAVNAVTGACLLIRREVWQALGGFDRAFGRGIYEDVDLCWRARQQGHSVWYTPAATLHHHEHASQKAGRTLHDENEARNRQLLFARWGRLASDEHLFQVEGAPETPAPSRAEETLLLLTGAADLSAALDQYQARLDQDVLDLLDRLAAGTADPEARQSLAALAELIRPRLAAPKPAVRAVETLQWLLAQPDLPAALAQQADRLDEDLLNLVRLNAATARGDGKPELAGGLDLLADYIAAQLQPPAAPPAAAETLSRLLEAEDLPAALAEQAARLDADVLALVRENAAAARADGDLELAEGLGHLADYIAGVLTERAPAAAD
ncbi:MAG: glycosyltransferase, partial [Anaerolineales bacterium]|nr:glycosyltransferase [Anaerolineales bacterium]